MEHEYIEEHNLVDRYLSSRLPAAERIRFEDHFVECPTCLNELELAGDFQASLRAGVAQQVSRKTVELGILAWLMRPAGRALVLGGLLILAIPGTWLVFSPKGGQTGTFQPQVNIPTYTLGSVRSGEQVLTSPAARWLSLALETDEGRGFSEFRLTVTNAEGEVAWQRSGIEPNREGLVTVTFPPGSLPAGEYCLELAGLNPQGEPSRLESHFVRLTE